MAELADLSTPFKAGAIGVTGGGLTILGFVFREDRQVLLITLLGVIAVVLLLVAYRWFLARRRLAQADTMGENLKAGIRRKPREINNPEALAKIADLQTKFEEGVEKFRAAGKDLYSLPWYLLVGEPGSGKTEAIRHCNVGFPPGLQEEQQGVGGTVNMNWWFTNHAIILDTAGRLMFDQVEAAGTGEWKEFLKLLLKARPKCPINGLLLVIPADSLIVDTADKIEAKAGKIAKQLDTIQRTLGVRFPVFVVITKSDKINGFREFFDPVTNPRLQHQMMGWSNPDPLDAPFNPELVEAHLAAVEKRLARRRLGLLLDPINTEDPSARRVDQVDALYAFPESLAIVGPRLRQYLEMIFVAGEWSPKPLFLRGMYFTSAMREGSALDKDLADLLGVPVESLPEGRVWEKDRAFFLRDLFMTKVFREKGLVTHASSARSVQRRRKVAVLAAGFIAVLGVSAMTVFGVRQLRQNVGEQARYWSDLQSSYVAPTPESVPNNLAILTSPVREARLPATGPSTRSSSVVVHYRGAKQVAFGKGEYAPLRDVYRQARKQVEAPVTVPPAFFWARFGPGFQQAERREAYAALFEATVLAPVVNAARDKLKNDPPLGNSDRDAASRACAAVEQLLRLESLKDGRAATPTPRAAKLPFDTASPLTGASIAAAVASSLTPAADGASRPDSASASASASSNSSVISVDPLFRFVLDDADYAEYILDGENIQGTCDWLYPAPAGDSASRSASASLWPFRFVTAGSDDTARPLLEGIKRLSVYWNAQFGDQNAARLTVQLTQALERFAQADAALATSVGVSLSDNAPLPPGPREVNEATALYKTWSTALETLRRAGGDANKAVDQINAQGADWEKYRSSLVALYRFDRARAATLTAGDVNRLLDAWGAPLPPTRGKLFDAVKALRDQQAQIESARKSSDQLDPRVDERLRALDAAYFKLADTAPAPYPYQRFMRAYTEADTEWRDAAQQNQATPPVSTGVAKQLGELPKKWDDIVTAGASRLQSVIAPLPDSAKVPRDVCTAVVQRTAVPWRLYNLLDGTFRGAVRSLRQPSDVEALVKAAAAARQSGEVVPALPMTVAPAVPDPRYDPNEAANLASAWVSLAARLNPPGSSNSGVSPLSLTDLNKTFTTASGVLRDYLLACLADLDKTLSGRFTVAPITWTDLKGLPQEDTARAAEGTLKAFDVRLRSISDAATTGGTNVISSDAFTASVDKLRKKIKDGLSAAESGSSARVNAVRKWTELAGKTPAEARLALISRGPRAVADEYMIFAPADANLFDSYWNQLTYNCLLALANASAGGGGNVQTDLMVRYNQFPLVSPARAGAANALSMKDLREALDAFESIERRERTEDEELAKITDEKFREAYRRLKGAGGADDAARRTAVRQRIDLVRAMVSAPGKPANRFTVTTVEAPQQARALLGTGRSPAGKAVTNVSLYYGEGLLPGGGPLRNPQDAFPPDDKRQQQIGWCDLRGEDGDTFRIRFDDGSSIPDVTFKGSWACLRALYETGAKRESGNGKVWIVPVNATPVGGKPSAVCLRFTFEQPLPPLP